MYYRNRALAGSVLFLAAVLGLGAGCKKKNQQIDPDDEGKLRQIAANLEEAFGKAAMPEVEEPRGLGERLERWDDFRECTIRTYVARKRIRDQHLSDGLDFPTRHASVGDEVVEECAVQMAIANKDASVCERLAIDYRGPSGQMPLSAVRCWDTRARVFGLPEECPVVWTPAGQAARNPECLALAHRDQSFCPFTDSPGRCQALLTGDSSGCSTLDASPDCLLALDYWRDIIPKTPSPPVIAHGDLKEKPLSASFDFKWKGDTHPHIRVEGPKAATGLSWPAGKSKPAFTEDTKVFWGGEVPLEAVQITWPTGAPAIKLSFVPGGASSGVRPIGPPSPAVPATFMAVWAKDPNNIWRCAPGPMTTGQLRFEAEAIEPGALVTGTAKAENVPCSDDTVLELNVTFRAVILDVR